MIPVLIKTELRKASENELKLKQKRILRSLALFKGYNFVLFPKKSPQCFPM